jgi:hypothetical protein
MKIIKPLHIGTVGGGTLRFFRTPLDDGRPDFPWHAVDDLQQCLHVNREFRRIWMRKLRSKWKEPQTITTDEGITVVAPHFMAQGLIDALIENGFVHKTAYAEYAHAGIEATKLIAPATSDPDAWVAWMKAAMNRWENH